MSDPAWVALSMVEHIGRKKLNALIAAFGSAEAAIHADMDALQRVPGIGAATAQAIRRLNIAQTEAALRAWAARGVETLALDDPRYPARLRALEDAPATLFLRANAQASALHGPAAALVGTRSPSPAGIDAARVIAFGLAAAGVTVVSGLALGIDTLAHQGALASGISLTCAVLGGGVLNPYPPQNRALADDIARSGALISEQHPLAESKPQRLVARNRIITGLASAVIVVETAEDGGAMHAARRALAQQRTLFALDLPASGNQALLAGGAHRLLPDDLSPVFAALDLQPSTS